MVSFVSVAPSVFRLWNPELTVSTLFSDVTIKHQVVALHSEICTTMPPIAGVVQGSSMSNSLLFTCHSPLAIVILRAGGRHRLRQTVMQLAPMFIAICFATELPHYQTLKLTCVLPSGP